MESSFEKNNINQESKFTPELRKKLSDLFMKFLDERKVPNKEREKFALEVVGISESELIAIRNLKIFKGALYDLIESPYFPDGKTKIALKISLENLIKLVDLQNFIKKMKDGTISYDELSKLDDPTNDPFCEQGSYLQSVSNIISILKNILTPEINTVIDSFKNKIFLEPLKDVLEDKNENDQKDN